MLVLSRKRCQQITIDETITITILEVGRKRVRLGIEAPREMTIHRPGETDQEFADRLVSVAV